MRERHPDNPHLLIVIDSLHSWIRSGNSNLPEYEAINDGMLTLGRLATELCCPILVISERNRATMNDGGMSSGAGSRVIEYGSESVIELQPETDKETKRPVAFDGAGNRRVFVTFNKNRHGEPGKRVPLLWNGALQRFSEPKA
jgi:replicative DNA helicase